MLKSKLTYYFLLSILILGLAGSAHGQSKTDSIVNQARVSFRDLNIDDVVRLKSPVITADRIERLAHIELQKNANKTKVSGGEIVSFQIDVANTGEATASGIRLTIDGRADTMVLIEDVIPTNSKFEGFDFSDPDVTYLVHYLGDSQNDFHALAPGESVRPDKEVDKVAFAVKPIAIDDSYVLKFSVRLDEYASGTLANIASVRFAGSRENIKEQYSNEVRLEIEEIPPQIAFYTSSDYEEVNKSESIKRKLWVQGIAATCNDNPLEIETVEIQITSSTTGDVEQFVGEEAGINSPKFRIDEGVITTDIINQPVIKRNTIIETIANDMLKAKIISCGPKKLSAESNIIIEPFGVVFNSVTNEPVPNAKVTLIGQFSESDKGGNLTSTTWNVMTDKLGRFTFTKRRVGIYTIKVAPPGDMVFPSRVMPEKLPKDRRVEHIQSYGSTFEHKEDKAPIVIDIPVDVSEYKGLKILKEAARREVVIGEFLDYSIDIVNEDQITLESVVVHDTLPDGFKYEKGTARLNSKPLSRENESVEGSVVAFRIGDMAGNEEWKLTYRVEVKPEAMLGTGINTAQARSTGLLPKISNISRTKTEVRGGVFSDEGFIIGKVFLDENNNKQQDDGEPGIPGVRLIMENGNFVITDGEGLYSLYGIEPEMHVLKVDPLSLPQGARLVALDNRFAGDPGSRFVDLAKGSVQKADFAVCNCGDGVQAEVEDRRLNWSDKSEYSEAVSSRLRIDNPARINMKSQPSQGYKNGQSPEEKVAISAEVKQDTLIAETGDSTLVSFDLSTVEDGFGLAGISDGDTLSSSQTSLQVVSTYGAKVMLQINGKVIDERKIGTQTVIKDKALQILEYFGLALEHGKNEIILQEFDPFNNMRKERKLLVFAPGNITGLQIKSTRKEIPANGYSVAELRISMVDESGISVASDQVISLNISGGTLNVNDIDLEQEGVQTRIEGTSKIISFVAPNIPQTVQVQATAGRLSDELIINVLPDLRPLVGAGIVEGTVNLSNGSILQSGERDGFYREIEEFAYESHDGNFSTGARGSVYLKGKVLGKYLLTLSYDSEKDDEPLFRDIRPDEYYPVYGDASIRGFDAQSTGKLYVRVDRNRSYLQYGDYQTQAPHPAVELGRYNRNQTGLKGQYETDKFYVNGYGTIGSSRQMIEELEAQGTSGPFFLKSNDILENSEQVEIITRDRNRRGDIIERTRLVPFQDYTIDEFTGSLILKQPVASFDADLNPNFIRITYEIEQGGEDYFAGGSTIQYKLTDGVEAGISGVLDENPDASFNLQSANITARLATDTYLIGEGARSFNEDLAEGYAGRLKLEHQADKFNLDIHALESDEAFKNPSALIRQSSREFGLDAGYDFTSALGAVTQIQYAQDQLLNIESSGALAGLQASFGKARLELAARYSRAETLDTTSTSQYDVENTTLRAKAQTAVPGISGLNVYGEYEQEISDADRKIIGAGADYRIRGIGKVYARHEFISSLGNQYALNGQRERNVSMLGIDASYSKNGEVFSEYRVRDAFNGREAQASIGLRNRLEITDGVSVNTSLERINRVTNSRDAKTYAATGAVEYTANPNWKGSTRTEFRYSENNNSYLNTTGIGYRLSPEWTLLAKNLAIVTDARGDQPTKVQNRTRIGLAFRDINTSVFDGLFMYEYKMERNASAISAESFRGVHIGSAHLNYRPDKRWNLSLRSAAKHLTDRTGLYDTKAINFLLSPRSMVDIGKRWDAGIQGSFFTDGKFESNKFGVGIEAGYRVAKNLRVAVGYNVFGFSDKDFNEQVRTQRGIFAKMSFKFDERIFGKLLPESQRNASYVQECNCLSQPEEPIAFEVKRLPEQPILHETVLSVTKFEPRDIRSLEAVVLPKNIHFASDESAIDVRSAKLLDRVVAFMFADPEATIILEGHTDDVDSDAYNRRLSLRRVESVSDYFLAKGISSSRIKKGGRGEGHPIIVATGDLERALNRRVEISFETEKKVRLVGQLYDIKTMDSVTRQRIWDEPPVWLNDSIFSSYSVRKKLSADRGN